MRVTSVSLRPTFDWCSFYGRSSLNDRTQSRSRTSGGRLQTFWSWIKRSYNVQYTNANDRFWVGQCARAWTPSISSYVTLLFRDPWHGLLWPTADSFVQPAVHVINVVRACTYHTRALRHIRPLLIVDAAKTIASAIVGARLNYCNSLLLGTSEYNLDRLQRVQNRLARVVLPFSAGATEARHELHCMAAHQTANV